VSSLDGSSSEITYENSGGVLFFLWTDTESIQAALVKDTDGAFLAMRIASGEDPNVADKRLIKDGFVEDPRLCGFSAFSCTFFTELLHDPKKLGDHLQVGNSCS
jgi:hypothetical protein